MTQYLYSYPNPTGTGGGGISTTLTNTHVLVGNASNVATDVAVSGDATMANTGALTVTNAAVIGKVLTGFSAGAGTVAATDTILQGFNKVVGNIGAGAATVFQQWQGSGTVLVAAGFNDIGGVSNISVPFATTRFYNCILIINGLFPDATTTDLLTFRLMIDNVANSPDNFTPVYMHSEVSPERHCWTSTLITNTITLGTRSIRIQVSAQTGGLVTLDGNCFYTLMML